MELTQERVRQAFDYREDGELIWRIRTSNRTKVGAVAGHVRKDGYKEIRIDGELHLLHRLVFLWHHGYMPAEVDHRDLNPKNSRIDNLRECTSSQNKCNRRMEAGNKTGFKGVYKHNQNGNFVARIAFERKKVHIGCFDTPEEAHDAYVAASNKLHGEFARAA